MIEATVLLGVDAKTLPQLAISAPTWRKYRPELWRMPWFVFFDDEQVTVAQLREVLTGVGRDKDVRAFKWPRNAAAQYQNQREKMLSGFCHTCRYVLREADWAPAEWFEPDLTVERDAVYDRYAPGYNVWVASPWGYTKPAEQMQRLDNWADGVPGLKEYPRLDIDYEPGARRARHPRMASWLSFYRSDWTRYASDLALHWSGDSKIPVPSQDGYHFYVAKRRGDRVLRAQMKRRGWTNCPRLSKLKDTARAALAGEFEQ